MSGKNLKKRNNSKNLTLSCKNLYISFTNKFPPLSRIEVPFKRWTSLDDFDRITACPCPLGTCPLVICPLVNRPLVDCTLVIWPLVNCPLEIGKFLSRFCSILSHFDFRSHSCPIHHQKLIRTELTNKPNKFDIDETILLLDADSTCLKILQSFIYLCPSKFEKKY